MNNHFFTQRSRILGTCLLGLLCLGLGPAACKDQFQVNPPDANRDWEGRCAGHPSAGAFVVVWAHWGAASGPDVDGQLFDFSGEPVTDGDFRANTSSGADRTPAAAMNASGAFAVAWCDDNTEEISVRTYAADATSTSGEITVAPAGTGSYIRTNPMVAIADTGEVAVVWEEAEYDPGDESYLPTNIMARFYNAAGASVAQGMVNVTTTGNQQWPSVAALTGGGFVIVWQSLGDIYARRYTAAGSSVTNELFLNSAPGSVSEPCVAELPGGGYVAVWRGDGYGSDIDGIQLRCFAADNSPLAAEIQVNTDTAGAQHHPWVDADTSGYISVVWESDQSTLGDNDSSSIQGQILAPDLSPYLDQYQVNTITTGAQTVPSTTFSIGAGFPNIGYAVVWYDIVEIDSYDDERNVQAKCYTLNVLIFEDDFESGDTSAWSSTI